MKIPYGKQEILESDLQAVLETLQSDYLTQGPKVAEFEQQIANYHGAKYAVAFCNGTAALHACNYAIGTKPGDEIISSPITFVASLNGALYCGAKPVLVDIDPTTNCLDYNLVVDAITSKTKVVCPVSFAGYPYDLKALRDKIGHDISIIHDAAHAIGSLRDSQSGCEYADLTILSFHPVKHITTGEGGMVLTNNDELYQNLLQFRTHGITKDEQKFKNKSHGKWYYEMQNLGYNYRITDFQCALGIEQFKRIEENLFNRNKIAHTYNKAFKDLSWLKIPPTFELSWVENGTIKGQKNLNAYHLYTVEVNEELRKEFFDYLHSHGILVQIHYVPVHLQPFYIENFATDKLNLPHSDKYYARTVSLPMFHSMSDEELNYIIKTVKAFRE